MKLNNLIYLLSFIAITLGYYLVFHIISNIYTEILLESKILFSIIFGLITYKFTVSEIIRRKKKRIEEKWKKIETQ